MGKRLLNEIKILLKIAREQIFSSPTSSTMEIRFSSNFHAQAKSWGLSKKDAEDAYYFGEPGKYPNQIIRRYPDRTIGISFFLHKKDGKPVITSIKKLTNYKK